MPSRNRILRPSSAIVLAAALGLPLSACRLDDAGLVSRAVGWPAVSPYDDYALAPGSYDLPFGPPAPLGRLAAYDDGYTWAERAYGMDYAFYQAPPDYGFHYDDVQPWVWESDDDWMMYAEPLDDGYRSYYYEPGYDFPFFIRDPEYAYGYDPYGRLVTVYDAHGRLMPVTFLVQRADVAGRYWKRAKDLRKAAERERRRRVAQDLWLARQATFARHQVVWIEAAGRHEPWLSYRTRTSESDFLRFRPERLRREAIIRRFDRDPDGRFLAVARDFDDGERERLRLAGEAEERQRILQRPIELDPERARIAERRVARMQPTGRDTASRDRAREQRRAAQGQDARAALRADDVHNRDRAANDSPRPTIIAAEARQQEQSRRQAEDQRRNRAEVDRRTTEQAQRQGMERKVQADSQRQARSAQQAAVSRQQAARRTSAEQEQRGREQAAPARENESRGQARRQAEAQQQQARAREDTRGREQAARSRAQAESRAGQPRAQAEAQQQAQAREEARGRERADRSRAEAEARAGQARAQAEAQQQARAREEARGREQARAQAEAQQQQARAREEARGRERAERSRAETEARAGQARAQAEAQQQQARARGREQAEQARAARQVQMAQAEAKRAAERSQPKAARQAQEQQAGGGKPDREKGGRKD